MGRLRSLEKKTPKKAIFSTVLSKIVGSIFYKSYSFSKYHYHLYLILNHTGSMIQSKKRY